MLVRSSSPLTPDFYILTVGHTCHYLLRHQRALWLFDPGPSAHWPALAKRITDLGLALNDIKGIFLTHLHSDRVGGVPALKKMFPNIRVCGSGLMAHRLTHGELAAQLWKEDQLWTKEFGQSDAAPLSQEEYAELFRVEQLIVDSEGLLGSEIRAIFVPGHTDESIAYYFPHQGLAVVDEVFGYYQGSSLAAPGGDIDLTRASQSISKFDKLELNGLCCSYVGALTGALVRKHMAEVIQNTADLKTEVLDAQARNIGTDEIKATVRESFYLTDSGDPMLKHSLERSYQAVLNQIGF